jgi:hypothetical protein
MELRDFLLRSWEWGTLLWICLLLVPKKTVECFLVCWGSSCSIRITWSLNVWWNSLVKISMRALSYRIVLLILVSLNIVVSWDQFDKFYFPKNFPFDLGFPTYLHKLLISLWLSVFSPCHFYTRNFCVFPFFLD